MATAVPHLDKEGHAAAVMVVLDIFPEMTREMICNTWPPKNVLMLIQNDEHQILMKNFTPLEQNLITNMNTNGYNNLDISCLYKVIRHCKLLQPPKQGWGNKPKDGDQSAGDDVERMRILRNDIIHRPRGGLSESDKYDFFKQSKSIAKRIDTNFGPSQNSFENRIKRVEVNSISREKYIEVLEKCSEYQARLGDTERTQSFTLYYGNDIKLKTDDQCHPESRGDSSSRCTIYLKDPNFNVEAVIQMLDEIKEKLNAGSYGIQLEDAKIGSLILHVTIPAVCFMTKEILHETIQSFLQKFFLAASIMQGHTYTVVLAESDYHGAGNEFTNLDFLKDKSSPVLKLKVNVRDSTFQNEFVLYREVNSFLNEINNALNIQPLPANGSAMEVLMLHNQLGMAQEPVVSAVESNYFRIFTLLLRIAPRAVRIKFDDVFQPEHLKDTLNSNSSKLSDLKKDKCFNQSQWNFMFPKTGDPTSQSFDPTLMICLFMNLKDIQIKNQLPPPTDLSVGADLSRIKRYRKDIAYSKDTIFVNENFEVAWNETEAAVMRLSDGKLRGECVNLKTKTYDVADRKKMHNRIKAEKRLVQIEELNVVDRVEKIDLQRQSDKNQDCIEKQIEEWEEEKKWFVRTNAFNFILKNLGKRVFMVVGKPGMGKSMLLHQIALDLKDTEGYSIVICHNPSDIVNQFRKDAKQVFILDDVCGKYSMVQSYIDKWNKYAIRIERVLKNNHSVIILASCRSHLYSKKQFQSLSICSRCICDLNAGECAIDIQQKLKIADKYLDPKIISEIRSDLNSFDMFPLSCRLYKDRKIGEPSRFFHDPFNFYKEELDNFYEEDDRMRCCSLFLCVLHSGCLNKAILMENSESDDFSRTLKIIFSNFRLDSKPSPKRILNILDTLLNTYLKKVNGQYYVIHDRLFDFLCYYFGQRYQHLVISYADSEIIRDRTLLKSLETSLQKSLETNPQEFTILIDKKYENEYIERLIQDMLSGYIDDVLYNPQIFHKDFRDRLLVHLQELDDDDVTVTCVLSEFLSDENERTSQLLPVNFACKHEYREMFNFFLSKTKDVNAYEGNNIPLITACRKGDKYMTGLLLEKGADVNQRDALGCSPLLWSCVNGNLDIIRMLLSKGADIDNIDDKSESSPLVWVCCGEFLWLRASTNFREKICSSSHANEFAALAVENFNDQFCTHEHFIEICLTILTIGHLKGIVVAKEQLSTGTPQDFESTLSKGMKIIKGEEIENNDDSLTGKNTNNQTQPFIEIMNLFLDRGVDIDKPSKGGLTAFAFACLVGICKDGQSINYLLSKGACVNIHDINGIYPLHFVICNGREDLVKLLIKNNALINCNGPSPLVSAINEQNVSIVNILITHKADINIRLENGSTLLHYAIQFNNADLINTLLKAGIAVNCEDGQGNTPLVIAVDHEMEEICNILIEGGAYVNTRNSDEITPLMQAVNVQKISIVRNLIEHKADINIRSKNGATLLHHAIQYNNADLIKTLLKAGIAVNCEDGQGNTPLMIAVDRGLTDICNILIKEGANVNSRNSDEITPLMRAVNVQNISIVSTLIEHKADINIRSKNGATLLHHAIQFNNADLINTLLKAGISVNSKDGQGNTPLMIAVDQGLIDICNILTKKGGNVNTPNYDKTTPLMIAVVKNNKAVTNILVKHGADINIRLEGGSTLLHRSIHLNNEDMICTLITAGISVNSEDESGNTPLMHAVNCSLEKILVSLIKEGADVNTVNNEKIPPLMIAVHNQNIAIIDILIQSGADINIRYKDGSTLLHRAVLVNNTDLVNTFLKAKISVNCEDGSGNTPLITAVVQGLKNIVEILLQKGAKVDAKNHIGVSALLQASVKGDSDIFEMIYKAAKHVLTKIETTMSMFLACEYNHLEVMGFLLQQGFDINTHVDKNGNTCLIDASKRGNESMVILLIEHGANVNASNYAGENPLTIASMKGHTAIVQFLIAKKANMYRSNKNGESPLFLACLCNHLEVGKVLIESGCNIESFEKKTKQTCLSVACYHAYDKIVTYLIEQGSNVNTQSNMGNTPLMLAASKGHFNIVKILLEHKADVNIKNEKGSTSLSLASSKGFDQIVTCLIEHEADVDTQSNIGTTPLILAALNGHFNIVKTLIENKADVNIQNDKGSTGLSVASSKGFDKIVTYLLDKKASINTANSDWDSPLMLASKNGHVSTVKILLENRAEVDMKNKEGLSSLDLPRKCKHVADIAGVLCEFIQSNGD